MIAPSPRIRLTLNGPDAATGRRSVCVERLEYDPDGAIQPIDPTDRGVAAPAKP